MKEYPQFEAALSLLSAVPPDEAVALLEARIASARGEGRGAAAPQSSWRPSSSSRYSLVEVDFQLALIEAERQFIGGLVERIKVDEDYVRTWKNFHAGQQPEGGTQPT